MGCAPESPKSSRKEKEKRRRIAFLISYSSFSLAYKRLAELTRQKRPLDDAHHSVKMSQNKHCESRINFLIPIFSNFQFFDIIITLEVMSCLFLSTPVRVVE